MHKLCTLLFLISIPLLGSSNAEKLYYHADGEKLALHADESTLVIHFNPAIADRVAQINLPNTINFEIHEIQGRALLTFSGQYKQADIDDISLTLGSQNLYSAVSGFMLSDGFKMALTHEVVAEFAEGMGPESPAVRALGAKYGASYNRDEYGTSIFRVSDPIKGLQFTNTLVEQGMAIWAHPDFYAKVTKYNDPLYPQQYQMNNTGQVVNGYAGLFGIDCNAPPAWAVTTGLSTTVIAVIDDGLEAHEDLVDESNATRILSGNTPVTGGSGTPRYSSDAHGMACTGIIAATHNNAKGVRGVAPNVKLRSVNIFWGGETTQNIANGINWARTQGVDIMSNSWGYASCTVSYSNINSALSSARTNGRGGKGCIVVFASGNGSKTCIDYPANRSDVIAVGAVTNIGTHSNYSNAGPQLSLVAPSDADFGQAGASVRTIDRMGVAGYNSGNYESFFGGTSAACPVVSGVAALLIAVNPDLTEAQVRSTLQTTASDMGTTGFDNTYGYGRVNAGAAVAAIAPPPPACTENELLLGITFDNYPEETSWNITDVNLNIIASGGTYPAQPDGSTLNIALCALDGCYTLNMFDIYGDGLCCQFGNGSFTLSEVNGGAILASGGQFTFDTSLPFCLGTVEEPASCTPIDFNNYPLLSYGGGGLDVGFAQVQNGGATLYQQNNSLKAILLNYVVTENTILEFEFRCTQQAQMHGIGFHNTNQVNPSRIFKIYGTQDLGTITAYNTYTPNNFVQFSIPVGQYYTGANLTRLFFLTGNYAGNPKGISEWRNVRVYETGDCTPALIAGVFTNFEIADISLSSSSGEGYRMYPNPTRDNVEILAFGGAEIESYRIFNTAGMVVASEVVNTTMVSISLSHLSSGVYFAEWIGSNGQIYREKLLTTK